MNLFLLRHGIAADLPPGGKGRDSERPLTPKGERKLWRIAEGMEALKLSFDLILSSPYRRARQTAEIIAEAFNAKKCLEFSEELTPPGSAKKLLEYLSEETPPPKSVLLVGHEPYMSELISMLVAGDRSLSLAMKKGGLCKLEIESLHAGRCATLAWLLTPKQLALIG